MISIPPSLFPGVVNALHIRLDHPSRSQLANLITRYFYTPGWKAIVDEVTDCCHQCATVRKLPKVLLQDSTEQPTGLATNFSADVIERHAQKLLIVRENLSQYTRGASINDQTSLTLQNALLPLVIDLLPDAGASIRVDGATGFQALQKESETPGTILNKLGLKIVIGRLLNKNKNPVAENTVQEVQKEILQYTDRTGPITHAELTMILNNVNSRIRYNGYSPKEILFRRNAIDNKPINIQDDDLTQKQTKLRQSSSQSTRKLRSKTHSLTPPQAFKIGDLVLLRNVKDKNNPRELHIIEDKE